MNDPRSETDAHPLFNFWTIYALVFLALSLGCVADDLALDVGEIGVCGVSTDRAGEQRGLAGYLGFYHDSNAPKYSADYYQEFEPDIVEGAFNTYFVSHWDSGENARIESVTTSDPDVVWVAEVYESAFVVEAIRPGSVEIQVSTESGISDRIELYVSGLDRVDQRHCCVENQRAYYLTDSDIEVPITFYDRSGQDAIGFGLFPFEVSDEDNLSWLSGVEDPTDLHLRTGRHTGNVTLTPTVDGAPLTLELLSPDQVDGISVQWEEFDYTRGEWLVGGVLHRNSTPICAGDYPMRVEVLSPETCILRDNAGSPVSRVEIFADEVAYLEERRTSGECDVRVELLDRDDGSVLVSQDDSRRFGTSER